MNSLPVPIGSHLAPLPIARNGARTVMAVLNAARLRQKVIFDALEERAGVSRSSWHGWRSGAREPSIALLLCVAQALGFDIIVRVNGAEIVVQDVPALVSGRFDARRRKLVLTLPALAAKSGVSAACWSAVALGKQSPRLSSFVALANALGFDVLMRQRLSYSVA
jgi:transcriptional regulator with XRE-family HTH domain